MESDQELSKPISDCDRFWKESLKDFLWKVTRSSPNQFPIDFDKNSLIISYGKWPRALQTNFTLILISFLGALGTLTKDKLLDESPYFSHRILGSEPGREKNQPFLNRLEVGAGEKTTSPSDSADWYHRCSAPSTNSVEPVVIKPVRTCWVLPVCGFRFGSNLLNPLVIKWIFLNPFGEPLWTCFPAQRWLIIVQVWTKTRSRPRSQKRHRHKNVRTEILCRMVQ